MSATDTHTLLNTQWQFQCASYCLRTVIWFFRTFNFVFIFCLLLLSLLLCTACTSSCYCCCFVAELVVGCWPALSPKAPHNQQPYRVVIAMPPAAHLAALVRLCASTYATPVAVSVVWTASAMRFNAAQYVLVCCLLELLLLLSFRCCELLFLLLQSQLCCVDKLACRQWQRGRCKRLHLL